MSIQSPTILSDEDGYGDKPIELHEAQYAKISAPVGHRVHHTDDLITNYDYLELEYETFGSMNDNVTVKAEIPGLVYEDSTFDESRGDEEIPDEAPSTTDQYVDVNTQTGELPVKSAPKTPIEEEIPPLQVLKTRDVNTINANATRRISSFKVKKINDSVLDSSSSDAKLEGMAETLKALDQRIFKIQKELKFLDSLLPPNPHLNSKPEQQEKLLAARTKLFNKFESLEKEKYELGIKIQSRSVKVNGYNGGDKAQFWVRGVSN
ncbi:unnamed protein product [Kuraishia capsulata CBS 1993]|uniref:Uncharacterized protein n=1 Tax=Kuraishia capsulata CBS 1993 TaxID=1382522 RepID=W6MKR0_9ASCO|nr:uncharacterized protein KUCA_T00002963001 [Kuraishia capsulata CBS 1993]CDK26986.1 unnamed protein product [Kuraishia capsulata CBS 1993]